MALVSELLRGQDAFETGVATERARIARDLHDNISIHLLGALHSHDTERKNALVRETLGDLRRIIADDFATESNLGTLLSELRLSLAEMLAAQNIELNWPVTTTRDQGVSEDIGAGLRAVLREAVTNVVKHAGAQNVSVDVELSDKTIQVTISDDGVGLRIETSAQTANAADGAGQGLSNMRARIDDLGGQFDIEPGPAGAGTIITLTVPRFQTSGTPLGQLTA